MEAISRKQGELDGLKRDVRRDIHDGARIESIAAVDAVHFSTKIEGNTLSRDQVTQALQVSQTKKKLKAPTRELNEVLNYSRVRRMMREWSLKAKPLNDGWVLEHHAELLKGIFKGRLRGHYREAQCVVQDSRTRSIVYMAPEWRDVPPLMKGLLGWLRKQRQEGMSPLLLAAQFHFEFVTIHPFMDGNGRLGRLLTNGILFAGGYDVERYAALEKQHELDRARYYHALRSMQAGNFYDIPEGQNIQPWVEYWLRCLLSTYEEALSRVVGTVAEVSLRFHDDDRLSKAEAVFRRHQRLKASQYADLMGLGRTQAVADINVLLDAGVVERVGGGRSTVYRWKEVGNKE
jgi:Fic family protein